ncbi:hypothetical protein MKW94_026927 [Papaver nudicaule]|uniref:MADS-box domain-containing protein n=1 Tax=Papaver nudicaule TaxID=74823 RepID=A0AA41RX40_PAPNU|nr:hypothetical protein [Papaver nudicaule]
MGKRTIEIKKIEDDHKRNVTFTKRRQGLFKKAHELSSLTGACVSLLVLSPAGKPFTFSSSSSSPNHLFNCNANGEEEDEEEVGAGDGFWWNQFNVEEIDTMDELMAVSDQLLQVKEEIARRKRELLAKPIPTATDDFPEVPPPEDIELDML